MARLASATSVQSVAMKPTGWPVWSATAGTTTSSENSGIDLALGPAEMGEQDGLAVDLDDFADGGDDALDAGRIGHLAVGDGDVEVGSQQHALVAEVELIEGLEIRHLSCPLVAVPAAAIARNPWRATVPLARGPRPGALGRPGWLAATLAPGCVARTGDARDHRGEMDTPALSTGFSDAPFRSRWPRRPRRDAVDQLMPPKKLLAPPASATSRCGRDPAASLRRFRTWRRP